MNYDREKYFLLRDIPEDTLRILKENTAFIAGGAITSVFSNAKINDYDIYTRTGAGLTGVRAYFSSLQCLPIVTPNAITYKTDSGSYQVVTKDSFIGEPDTIINNFDYTICMGAYDFSSDDFILHNKFLLDLSKRILCFNADAQYPLCSLFRLRKFSKRGFTISGSEIIKLGLAVNNIKITNYGELREQLLGIDTLFLKELTDTMLSKKEIEYDFNNFLHEIDAHITKYYSSLFEDNSGE